MRAAVFLNQPHPNARVMLERGHLVEVNRVAQETGNHHWTIVNREQEIWKPVGRRPRAANDFGLRISDCGCKNRKKWRTQKAIREHFAADAARRSVQGFSSQSTVISRSTCLNSRSPVAKCAFLSFARAAAKQSVNDILFFDLK